jgi:hypothetical protein
MSLRLLARTTTFATLTGCFNCTEVGCSGGIAMKLLPSTPLTEGSYELILDGDSGFTETCAFTLTEDEEACGESTPPCLVDIECPTLTSTRGDDFSVEPSMHFDTLDAEVTITLALNGVEVHSVVLEPEYETFSPNGERCGPTCTSTYVEMQFDMP